MHPASAFCLGVRRRGRGAERQRIPGPWSSSGRLPVQGSNVTAARDAAIASGLMQAVAPGRHGDPLAGGFRGELQEAERAAARPARRIHSGFQGAVGGRGRQAASRAWFRPRWPAKLIARSSGRGRPCRAGKRRRRLKPGGPHGGGQRQPRAISSSSARRSAAFRVSRASRSGRCNPNETTLLVGYKGTSEDLAAALTAAAF
ncbi:MAG: hypothetical protein MZV70_11985 [Desulfobacterales bacterium]|nr:hypothetical protein [Desulfobacterales bacterium]